MISFNEKPFVEKHATKIVAAFTIIGSGVAAYFGCRKAVCEAANAVIGVVQQNMHAPQPQQAASAQAADSTADIADAIAEAIDSKAEAEEAKAKPDTPSDAPVEKAEAEDK